MKSKIIQPPASWNTSLIDWESRILSGRSLIPNFPLFYNEKGIIPGLEAFKMLKIPDVPGRPTLGAAFKPWFLDFVAAIFGSLNPETQRRMISEFILVIGKKNGKSTGAAGIMLAAAATTTRPNDEGTYVSATKEIAEIAFGQTKGMIKADSELDKIFYIQDHIRTVTNRENDCVIKIKAADSDAITGIKGSFAFVDETHEFSRKLRAADILLELRGALAARPDGFLLQATTQSKTPPTGVFKAELDTARKVRDGELKLPLLPVIYELPTSLAEEWRDRRYWGVVNPNLGITVDEAFLESQLAKADAEGPAALQLFASQHFNVEMGVGLRSDGWAGAKYWLRGVEPGLGLDQVLERSDVCAVGIDGGGLDDLLGLAVIGREKGTRRWLGWAHAYISPEGMEQRKANAGEYAQFIADGDLELVDELPQDLARLTAVIKRVLDAGKLGSVGVDPIGIPGIVEALAEIKVTSEAGVLMGVGQGISLMGSFKGLERKLVDGTFKHGGSSMLAWCVGNAKLVSTPTAQRIARDASGYGKIDPLVALFDAADGLARDPKPFRVPSYQMFFMGGSSTGNPPGNPPPGAANPHIPRTNVTNVGF